jgi:hypothetical protein
MHGCAARVRSDTMRSAWRLRQLAVKRSLDVGFRATEMRDKGACSFRLRWVSRTPAGAGEHSATEGRRKSSERRQCEVPQRATQKFVCSASCCGGRAGAGRRVARATRAHVRLYRYTDAALACVTTDAGGGNALRRRCGCRCAARLRDDAREHGLLGRHDAQRGARRLRARGHRAPSAAFGTVGSPGWRRVGARAAARAPPLARARLLHGRQQALRGHAVAQVGVQPLQLRPAREARVRVPRPCVGTIRGLFPARCRYQARQRAWPHAPATACTAASVTSGL